MGSSSNAAWRDGWRRVRKAPAVAVCVWVMTFVLALPLAVVMRGTLQTHLGGSLAAGAAADGVNYDWWQEFTAQATGLGTRSHQASSALPRFWTTSAA